MVSTRRLVSLLLAASCLLSAALAVQPDFDALRVVRQVRGVTQLAAGVERSLDDGEFLIDTSGVHAEYRPAVAFDGANFLVVWEDPRSGSDDDIYGARVTPSGTVLDPSGFVISQAAGSQCGSALGFDGANFLVVWQDFRSGSDSSDIYGARVTPSGTVLDPSGFVISQATSSQYGPALGFDGANFLVVWNDPRSGSDDDIYGARVTPSGTVLDPSGLVVSQAAGNQCGPALGFDGANSLVVWSDLRSGSDGADIYGARVTPSGTVLDPLGFVVSQAAGSQCGPALRFDGANFLMVWPDGRSGSDDDIYGARVTPAGVVFDEGPVVRQDGNQGVLALCRGSGSQMFLVYLGWTGTVGGKTYNTDRIWGKMNPSPGIEETMDDGRGTMNDGPTIVRDVLFLSSARGEGRQASGVLLDAMGRKVAELHAGANDVSGLAPGVYFVRAASRELSAVGCHKVVIQR